MLLDCRVYPNLAVVEAEAGAGPVRDHEGRAAGGGRDRGGTLSWGTRRGAFQRDHDQSGISMVFLHFISTGIIYLFVIFCLSG